MSNVTVSLPDGAWPAIRRHLAPKHTMAEEAVFIFAAVEEASAQINLRAIEWRPMPPAAFEEQSSFFLQLTDEAKAKLIKQAHDLQTALVEVHSHPFQTVAEFSPSDLHGFLEFVPHVRWRLQRRPYAAIVIAQDSFDGLCWSGEDNQAQPLAAVIADGNTLRPTHATLAWRGS